MIFIYFQKNKSSWTANQIPFGANLCEKTSTYLVSWNAWEPPPLGARTGNKSSTSFYDCIGRHPTRLLTTDISPPVRQRCSPERRNNMADREAEQKIKMKAYADQKLCDRTRHSKHGIELCGNVIWSSLSFLVIRVKLLKSIIRYLCIQVYDQEGERCSVFDSCQSPRSKEKEVFGGRILYVCWLNIVAFRLEVSVFI